MRVQTKNRGFTLIELLAVIAIIATLIGIILGSASFVIKLSREKRCESMRRSIANAIMAYRQQYYVWPMNPSDGIEDNEGPDGQERPTTYVFGSRNRKELAEGINVDLNKYVVAKLYQEEKDNKNRLRLLEEERLLTISDGERMPLSQARVDNKGEAFPLIYVDGAGKTQYYKIVFIPDQEHVRVKIPTDGDYDNND